MTLASRFWLALASATMVAGLAAATRPAFLARVQGGVWEIDPLGPGARSRQCLADPAVLASFRHRGFQCTQVVVQEDPDSALVHYTCTGDAGFGRSQLTALTPRSIRIETQGIVNGVPFQSVFQARRMGNC